MKVLPFPKENPRANDEARDQVKELRRFLETIRDSNLELHQEVADLKATMNTIMRELKKLVKHV